MKEESWTKVFIALCLVAVSLVVYVTYENYQLVRQYNDLVYDYYNLSDEVNSYRQTIVELQRINYNLTAENQELRNRIDVISITLEQTRLELNNAKEKLNTTKQQLNDVLTENQWLVEKYDELLAEVNKPEKIPLDLSKYSVELKRFPVSWDGDYMKYARGFKKFLMEDHQLVTDFVNVVDFVIQDDGTYLLVYKDTRKEVTFIYMDDREQFYKLDVFQNPSYFIHNELRGDCDDINPLVVRILVEKGYSNVWLYLGLKQGYGHIWGSVEINGTVYMVDFSRYHKAGWDEERAVAMLTPEDEATGYEHIWARIKIS